MPCPSTVSRRISNNIEQSGVGCLGQNELLLLFIPLFCIQHIHCLYRKLKNHFCQTIVFLLCARLFQSYWSGSRKNSISSIIPYFSFHFFLCCYMFNLNCEKARASFFSDRQYLCVCVCVCPRISFNNWFNNNATLKKK